MRRCLVGLGTPGTRRLVRVYKDGVLGAASLFVSTSDLFVAVVGVGWLRPFESTKRGKGHFLSPRRRMQRPSGYSDKVPIGYEKLVTNVVSGWKGSDC